jgi:hypothetical protein
MTDIQNICDRNSVTHNKNQNDTSNVFDIRVKNSSGVRNTGVFESCVTVTEFRQSLSFN